MSDSQEESREKLVDFDVIVGNPPYQEDMVDASGKRTANIRPLYQHFVRNAIKLNPGRIVMITPSRWFSGGKGLDEFRAEMLADRRIKRLVDYPDATQVFPGVQIKGGVSYFVWDRGYSGDCDFTTRKTGLTDVTVCRDLREGQGVLVRDARSLMIIEKALVDDPERLSDLVSKNDPFGQSIKTNYRFAQDAPFRDSIPLVYGDHIGYVRRDQIERNHDWIGKYKVLIPMASDGSGSGPYTVLGQPIALAPGSVCTQTYLVAGTFDTPQETENYANYLCTKLVRFLVLQRKSTQHVKPDKFLFVPKLDFTRRWTDEQLYDRFGLDEDERAYVESTIKEREPILSLDSPIPASHLPGGSKHKPKKKES